MILVQKIIRGLTTQIENQFKSMNEMYRYSTQNKPCFSNYIFSNLPNLTNSSTVIDDILMANMMNTGVNDDSKKDDKLGTGKLIFEHFLDYTVNCFDQLFFDFYSKDKSHDESKEKREIVSFFDMIRFYFYSSILSVLTSQKNINFLVFSPSMYKSFLDKFPDFLTNNISLALDINDNDKLYPLYIHGYYSIQNVLNSLSRFNIDIFKDYLNENDSKGRGLNILKICDAAILLVQNKQSLLSFTKDLTMMLELSSSSIEKSEFLAKLYQFFINLFITNTDLYNDIIQSDDNEIINNLHSFFLQIINVYHIDLNFTDLTIQYSTTSELNNVLPILCILLPFEFRCSNFEKFKDFIFNNFKTFSEKVTNTTSKEMILDYLNSYVALFQAVMLNPKSNEQTPSILEFVNSHKPIFDTFLFNFEANSNATDSDESPSSLNASNPNTSTPNPHSEVINSFMFLYYILPRYIALDISKASKDCEGKDPSSYSITQSVSFCTQSSNIYYSLSLIHGLSLLTKGYPIKEINQIDVKIVLNIIFNIVDLFKNPLSKNACLTVSSSFSSLITSLTTTNLISTSNSLSSVSQTANTANSKMKENLYSLSTVDDLHRDIYELISGHSFYGSGFSLNEYDLIPTFIDLIAAEASTSISFYHFMINEIRTNITYESKQAILGISDFSPDTITSFFVLLNVVFDNPSRWTIFSLESTNTNRFFIKTNSSLYTLYKDILKKNVTALFCFDSIMIKYLKFSKAIIKISKSKVNINQFIDDVERVLLLMNATSDILNSELANKELQKFAEDFKVPFLYQWPLQFSQAKSSHNDLIVKNDKIKISAEKQKMIKEKYLPVMEYLYLFWFEVSFRYLYQNEFIVSNTENSSNKQVSLLGLLMKSKISFQIIIRITSFLCRYSNLIDEIQPILTKKGIFKNAKIKFANALLDFVSHDIKDEVSLMISKSVSLFDGYTSNMLLKIIRSNLLSSSNSFSFSTTFISLLPDGSKKFKTNELNQNLCLSLHPNCYLFISELINEYNMFYNDQSYNLCEEIILNIISIISMDQKFKSNIIDEATLISKKSILFSISNIIYKFYGCNRKDIKSSQITRLSIISTILNFIISTRNSTFVIIIAKPLPLLFKDFVITAENEFSGYISNYENVLFIRKTIDIYFSYFFLILSSSDKSSLFSICQESLENILLANYKEAADIFVTSLLNYSKEDIFSKVILKSFISVIKKSPQIHKNYSMSSTPSSPYYKFDSFHNDLRNNSFTSIIHSNINSTYFYEAVIEISSYQNKLRQLFIKMCEQYHKSADINDSNFYEKINCPFFFIAFFKIAATNTFIDSISVFLLKMNVEKTTEYLLPPIQFVYYWQLFCRITNENPLFVLDKFFIRPIFLQPHLYNLNPNSTIKLNQGTTNTLNQCNTFINKLQQYPGMKLYLDHLMKDQIEYCEVYPVDSNKNLNSNEILFHFLSTIPNPGNYITYSNVLFDTNNINILDINKYDLAQTVFDFIHSQCLVCIDKDRSQNKNWLLNLDKIPENSIPIIRECFRVLISKSIEEINSKKNEFNTFYEESNINLTQANELSCSTDSLFSNSKSNSNDGNGNIPISKSKKRFSKPFFKMHSKKDKSEGKRKSKIIDNDIKYETDEKDNNASFLNQINLYINMRKLPSNYLSILEIIFEEKIKSINLIFTPIGILNEIETELIVNKNINLDHVKIISNIDNENDIIAPIHISTTKIQCNCQVNNNPGSIGFFQECIIISSVEKFRNQQYQVTTVTSFAQFKLPKIISKTAIEIEFKFESDKYSIESQLVTNIQAKKSNNIILDFNLGNNDDENSVLMRVTPEFIIDAMQSSAGSTIGDQKVSTLPPGFNSDPTISLIALSLFYIPNNDSIISETALELFWLVIDSFCPQKNNQIKMKEKTLNHKELSTSFLSSSSSKTSNIISNQLNLPLDGFIRVLQRIEYNNGCQESTLFSSVVQFLSNFLSIPKIESMQMMPFLSLTSSFLSTSSDKSALSGICHNLLLQFRQTKTTENSSTNDTNEASSANIINDYYQLLQIWSSVRSSSFATIALPQILIFIRSSVCQSQLIHCLTAKNKKVVNDVLIENLLYKDLVFYRLYYPICSNGLIQIFPLIQFLGKPEIIMFLNLVAALTTRKEIAQSFLDSIKSFLVYYQKNKQMISQCNDLSTIMINDGLNDEINDDDDNNTNFDMTEFSNLNAALSYNDNDNDNENDNDNDTANSFADLNFNEMFDPEKSNLYDSTHRVLSFLDKKLQDSVINIFENLTKTENSKVWYLKPSLSTSELLDAMTDSIVPELNMKKLCFCIASLPKHEDNIFVLFWAALPYLFSQYSYIRRLSANFISSIFIFACKKNNENKTSFIDPFEEFIKILNSSKNLQFLIKNFGDVIGINFEENLPIAFASILIGILLTDKKIESCIFRVLYTICNTYQNTPHKALIFMLILIVCRSKVSINFIQKFNVKFDISGTNFFMAISDFLKGTAASFSRFEILWILNLLGWAFSQSYSDGSKYQVFTIAIFEILKIRTDLPKVFKKELISRFLKFTDNKDQSIQEYLAFIFSIANSSPNEDQNDQYQNSSSQKSNLYDTLEKFLWVPKSHDLVEQHLHSFCVNFHATIKSIICTKT